MMKGEGKEDINLCLSYDRLSVSYVMFFMEYLLKVFTVKCIIRYFLIGVFTEI